MLGEIADLGSLCPAGFVQKNQHAEFRTDYIGAGVL